MKYFLTTFIFIQFLGCNNEPMSKQNKIYFSQLIHQLEQQEVEGNFTNISGQDTLEYLVSELQRGYRMGKKELFVNTAVTAKPITNDSLLIALNFGKKLSLKNPVEIKYSINNSMTNTIYFKDSIETWNTYLDIMTANNGLTDKIDFEIRYKWGDSLFLKKFNIPIP